jgi:hypothetical protein
LAISRAAWTAFHCRAGIADDATKKIVRYLQANYTPDTTKVYNSENPAINIMDHDNYKCEFAF